MDHASPASHREIEHTGDVGIEVHAPARAAMFREVALALAELMVDRGTVVPSERRTITVAARDEPEAMHDFLAALLNLFLIDAFIWHDVVVSETNGGVSAVASGELFDAARHRFRGEVKAITYHQLEAGLRGGAWFARVIFDV